MTSAIGYADSMTKNAATLPATDWLDGLTVPDWSAGMDLHPWFGGRIWPADFYTGVLARFGCDEKCWTPVPCPTCGDRLPPVGRSVPMERNISQCCSENQHTRANTCHFWSKEHAIEEQTWREEFAADQATEATR